MQSFKIKRMLFYILIYFLLIKILINCIYGHISIYFFRISQFISDILHADAHNPYKYFYLLNIQRLTSLI